MNTLRETTRERTMPDKKPNIVFILHDNTGWGDWGVYGAMSPRRALFDSMIAEKATDFIKRKAKSGVPFYTYIAFTHFHPREAVHPDFDQTSPDRAGMYADIIAEQDYRTGQVLDAIEEAGISDNTLVRAIRPVGLVTHFAAAHTPAIPPNGLPFDALRA